MTITIADGRGALWQWDTGRRLRVGSGVEQIHYQKRALGGSVDVDVGTDGTAIIPDELLQDWHPLTAYAYVTDDAGGYTKAQVDFAVHKRAKPAGYVYTPTDQMTLQTIQRQIGDLADLTTEEKENLVAAINEAARTGGAVKGTFYVTVTQGDGNSATADKTAAEVYAAYAAGYAVYALVKFRNYGYPYILPLMFAVSNSEDMALGFTATGSASPTEKPLYASVLYYFNTWSAWSGTLARPEDIPTIPTALKNPNALTIKIGSTTVTYDGSTAQTVTIADGTEVSY